MSQPALWYRGIADALQAWRRQLAAVRLPPGLGCESDVVHRLRLKAATGPYWPKGARKKKRSFAPMSRGLNRESCHCKSEGPPGTCTDSASTVPLVSLLDILMMLGQ